MAAIPTRSASAPRQRVRDALPGIYLGRHSPGPKNSLTDVPGVLVSTISIHEHPGAAPGSINTGITTILPRRDWYHKACFSGIFRFNGSGEMTGSHWIEETGLLRSPIVITGSFGVGSAYNGIYEHAIREHSDNDGRVNWFLTPVVAETYDGFMHDVSKFAVTAQHVIRGIDQASSEPVREGNTGGGTGMLCHWFKGGTGSSSRVVAAAEGAGKERYTIGALVQANYGKMLDFKIAGAPVGRLIYEEQERRARENPDDPELMAQASLLFKRTSPEKKPGDGSIIIVLATDAPLHPTQLQRLAKRATVGLSKVGGWGANSSGDIFLAFSTASEVDVRTDDGVDINLPREFAATFVDDRTINPLLEAVGDVVEESILNAVFKAETMQGFNATADALDLAKVKELMAKYL